jgi:DNA-binding transcriptional LysR family regulator
MRSRRDVRGPAGHPWAGVEVRHLLALGMIGQERSFLGAARRLCYAQSTISQQIANLERAVGTRLVERSGPVSLTPAGQQLAELGGDIMARLMAARADLASIVPDRHPETLKVAVDRLIAPRVLPLLICAADHALPDLSLTFLETDTAEHGEWVLARGKVDAVLGELPPPAARFTAEELLRDPIVLLVQADSPLARASDPPTPKQLAGVPLISTLGHFGAAGQGPWPVEPTIRLTTASVATALRFVRCGFGCALVPRLTVDPADSSIAVVDLGETVVPRRIGVYRHRHRRVTAATARFEALAQCVLAGLAPSSVDDANGGHGPQRDDRVRAPDPR